MSDSDPNVAKIVQAYRGRMLKCLSVSLDKPTGEEEPAAK